MANPGAIVGSGALVTPGGAQGPQGITGPSGPGSGDMLKATYDVNNDSIVDRAASADAVAWGNVTGRPSTFPPDATAMLKATYDANANNKVDAAENADAVAWTGVTGKPATFPPDATAELVARKAVANGYASLDVNTLVPMAQLPAPTSGNALSGQLVKGNDSRLTTLASASTKGLLNQTSGKTTDFLDGTQSWQDLATAIRPIGGAPPGAIMDYAGATAPTGWLLCDGSAVSRTTYAALFAAISTAFGAGDGSTTFNLPDARGRASIGAGQGSGLTNRALAANGGEEVHQLTQAELAAHTHIQDAHNHTQNTHGHTDSGHSHAVLSNSTGYTSGPLGNEVAIAGGPHYGVPTDARSANITNTTATNIATTATNQNTGGNGAHNTMPPFIAFNKIIKT